MKNKNQLIENCGCGGKGTKKPTKPKNAVIIAPPPVRNNVAV